MVEVMKIMATSFKRSHPHTATLSALSPATGHCQPTSLLETPGHSQAGLGQSLVGSLLLSPASWCTQGSVSALQSLFPQSCVSSGSSMVGLMATSSKRAYAIPGSTAPRAPPLQQSTADSYLFRTHSNTVVSASVESLGPDFTPPTILLGLLLCTWMWGISSKSFQRHTATTPVPTILLGLLCPWMWGISSQYLQHQAATAPVPHSCSTTL